MDYKVCGLSALAHRGLRQFSSRPVLKMGLGIKAQLACKDTLRIPRRISGEAGLVLLCAVGNLRGPSCRVWLALSSPFASFSVDLPVKDRRE